MTSGRAKQKGDRLERHVVDECRKHGITAKRVPLSGAVGGEFNGDVHAQIDGQRWTLECKSRANGFRQDYKWLGPGIDAVIKKADRQDPLITLHLGAFLALLEGRA